MKKRIIIKVQDMELTAELDNSVTADAIAQALPLEGRVHVWGDEIYFEIPVAIPLAQDAVEEVDVGALAYWPAGNAFCIFFGPTPVSTGESPRAYSPVNVFGRIVEETTALKSVAEGSTITVSGFQAAP